ncbi:uncharacterized protein [Channa argus]|uniref:uncharacterized protein isoform X2 n=1 Tax=Channa argus TaxID=215402 RepID=UPI00352076DC
MYYYILQYLLDMAGLCNVKTLLLLAWIICQSNTTAWEYYWITATSSPALTSNETSPTTTTETDPETNSTKISHSPADTQLNTSGYKTMKATSSPALTSNETSPTTSNKTDLQTSTTKISPSPATIQLNTSGNITTKDSPTSLQLTTTSSTSPLVTNKSVTTFLPRTTAVTSAVSSDTQTTTQKPEPPSSTLTTDSTKQTKHSDAMSATLSPAPTSNETSPTSTTKTDLKTNTTKISHSPATTQLNTTVTFTTKDSPTSLPLTTTSSTSPLVTNKSVTTLLPSTTATTSPVSSDTQTTTLTPEPPSSTLTTNSAKQTKHSDAMSATSSFTHLKRHLTHNQHQNTKHHSKPNLTSTHTPQHHSNYYYEVTSITPPHSTQCSYTVTPIKFGFWINITGSTNGTYIINITEEGQREIRSSVVYIAYQASHELKHLKPCTEYEHNVAFIESNGRETPCQKTENKTRTNAMSTGDIQVNNCRPGYVCYQSDRDISFSLSSSYHVSSERCTSDDKTLCIKLGNNDYCSDLTTTFTSGSCSLSLTTSITVDYINPSDIFQPVPTKLPAQIVPEFPINCRSLSIDYTCLDELNKPKKLTDLEPFTDYICTGQIKNNNVNTNKATTVRFRVDCDLTINTKNRKTNTSIELSWDTTSQNCPDVHELKKIHYTCSCSNSNQKVTITADKHPSGGTCHFTGLQPFTNYNCKFRPTYNNKGVSETKEVTVKTEAGIPDVITKLTVKVPENNMITVDCEPHSSLSFKGPQKRYIARLQYDSETPVVKNETNCHFEFKHLSYSTTYKLKVTVFNGYFESRPTTEEVSTLCDATSIIRYLVSFIFMATSVAVMVYISKFYGKNQQSKDDVNEDVMLETLTIYENPQASENENSP